MEIIMVIKRCLIYSFLLFILLFLSSEVFSPPFIYADTQPEKLNFANYYSYTPLDAAARAAPYKLPLKRGDISNFDDFTEKIPLKQKALKLLEKNGFVVIDNPFNSEEENITIPYEILKDIEVPIFITTDSLLHLYHIQFDETLRQIEEKEFYDDIWDISKTLLDESIKEYKNAIGDLKEALKRNTAYLATALSLLKPGKDQLCKNEKECGDPDLAATFFSKDDFEKYTFVVPDFVKDDVEKELKLIEKHEGFSGSPIFIYREDYSQYVPRGHYTRSEKLKNYFKTFMWYGRLSMLLKGTDQVEAGELCNGIPPCTALISLYDAKIQTMQAAIIASKFDEAETLLLKWDRIYSVTAFYVGFSDDLGPYEYIEALNYLFNGNFNTAYLTDESIGRLKAKLAEKRSPKIYGGTGEVELWPPFTPEQADEILEVTKGFRLMGQRFVPDSYMFSELVSPSVGMFAGDSCGQVFTCEMTQGGPARVFPRGLDAMALLGSGKALQLLRGLGDTEYKGCDKQGDVVTYDTQFNKLNQEFSAIDEYGWQKNLYWSWLYSLKALLQDFGSGYPSFMQTDSWQYKELTTALASWTELRHDTILYAKQSYTATCGLPPPPPENSVVGYIEPAAEFYNRLLALTKMTNIGLGEMNVLDKASTERLDSLEDILIWLLHLSVKELNNEELTKNEYAFIKNFGERLNEVIADVDEKAKKTTIVADVHTDQNTKQVLEEGVGYVKLMVVAYKVPDGRILAGAGPVMSYYEFKHPVKDRLTDEKWRELLVENPPNEPEWAVNYSYQNE